MLTSRQAEIGVLQVKSTTIYYKKSDINTNLQAQKLVFWGLKNEKHARGVFKTCTKRFQNMHEAFHFSVHVLIFKPHLSQKAPILLLDCIAQKVNISYQELQFGLTP